MIGDILQPTHLLFVLVVALLVLGPKRLPEAGRALGKGIRDFRSAIGGEDDHRSSISSETTQAPPAAPAYQPTAFDTVTPAATATATSPQSVAEESRPEPAETAHPFV
jgi:sec-independent protein translocase protein TatA